MKKVFSSPTRLSAVFSRDLREIMRRNGVAPSDALRLGVLAYLNLIGVREIRETEDWRLAESHPLFPVLVGERDSGGE